MSQRGNLNLSSLRDSNICGGREPAVETAGYYHIDLTDRESGRATVNCHIDPMVEFLENTERTKHAELSAKCLHFVPEGQAKIARPFMGG